MSLCVLGYGSLCLVYRCVREDFLSFFFFRCFSPTFFFFLVTKKKKKKSGAFRSKTVRILFVGSIFPESALSERISLSRWFIYSYENALCTDSETLWSTYVKSTAH